MRLFAIYAVAWVTTNAVLIAGWMSLSALTFFYLIVGPLAGVWVAARLGLWFDLGTIVTYALMMAGVLLFGAVRVDVYRIIARRKRRILSAMERARTLRDDLWRQYQRARSIPWSGRPLP